MLSPAVIGGDYPDSVKNCTACHNEHRDFPTLDIFKGPHGVLADDRTGLEELGCAACHGPSEGHARRPSEAPEVVFGPEGSSPREQDATCLECHSGGTKMHWHGSPHEFQEVSCSSCHEVHTAHDPALDRDAQADSCYTCHSRERTDFHRPFAHPVRDGQLTCTDCHNPHGSSTPGDLHATTLNESCYDCHAEKRGPFLWEHPPVREDCTQCHQPHGSVHRDMLTQQTPFLCQQCHMAQFHPSTVQSGTGLPGDSRPSGSTSMLGRDCMNCHTNVHGSNHPSGAGQTR